MPCYLLDTNIISDVIKPEPSKSLLAWMGTQKDDDAFHNDADHRRNPARHCGEAKGQKRYALDAWVAGPEGPQALFAGRILPFDEQTALLWARLMAEGKAAGRPRNCST